MNDADVYWQNKLKDSFNVMETIPTYHTGTWSDGSYISIATGSTPYTNSLNSNSTYRLANLSYNDLATESDGVKMKTSYDNAKEMYSIKCDSSDNLNADGILRTVNKIKGSLVCIVAERIGGMECIMTPAVRQNLVIAGKKLKMYGKKPPILLRFDEWGNRLTDELIVDSDRGVYINIVDPEEYGELYLEFRAYVRKW